jgi:ribosomal protein S18 acetylase RimI-like enzyme
MPIEVAEEPMPELAEYASVPISFQVRLVLDAVQLDGGLGGLMLTERAVDIPYIKDYDVLDGPETWAGRFDLRNWGWIVARADGRRVGCAAVAFDTWGVEMLERRRDLAVLWDIRVAPEIRGRGMGAALFRAAEAWAVSRRCREIKVETQNINVPACRFYRRQGCELGGIHRFAYPTLPHEVQLLWYKQLSD